MKLDYQITESDFMAAYQASWRSLKQGSRTNLLCGIIGLLVGIDTFRSLLISKLGEISRI